MIEFKTNCHYNVVLSAMIIQQFQVVAWLRSRKDISNPKMTKIHNTIWGALMYDLVWIEAFLSLLQHHMHVKITRTTCGSHHTLSFCIPPHPFLITPAWCPVNNAPDDLCCPITLRWYVVPPPPSQSLHTSHTYVFITHNPRYHCHQPEHFNGYSGLGFDTI